MAQKRKTEQPKLIAAAALSLAGKSGWQALTFPVIARRAKMKPADVARHFSDVWEILSFVLAEVESETAETVRDYMGDSWRDNLMEILMTRFDIAGQNRAAFTALARELPKNPKIIRRFAKTFYGTMDRMLDLAGFPASPLRPAAVAAFGLVYASAVEAWVRDDTRDQSKTMAVIDKRIGQFAAVAQYLSCDK